MLVYKVSLLLFVAAVSCTKTTSILPRENTSEWHYPAGSDVPRNFDHTSIQENHVHIDVMSDFWTKKIQSHQESAVSHLPVDLNAANHHPDPKSNGKRAEVLTTTFDYHTINMTTDSTVPTANTPRVKAENEEEEEHRYAQSNNAFLSPKGPARPESPHLPRAVHPSAIEEHTFDPNVYPGIDKLIPTGTHKPATRLHRTTKRPSVSVVPTHRADTNSSPVPIRSVMGTPSKAAYTVMDSPAPSLSKRATEVFEYIYDSTTSLKTASQTYSSGLSGYAMRSTRIGRKKPMTKSTKTTEMRHRNTST